MASQYDGGCRRGMTPQGDSGERVTWALRLEIQGRQGGSRSRQEELCAGGQALARTNGMNSVGFSEPPSPSSLAQSA